MSSSLWVIWADEVVVEKKKLDLLSPEILSASSLIVVALIVGAIIIAILQRWKRKQLADEDTDLDSVTSYRAMLASGELSREEYDRILKRVGQRALGKTPPEPAPQQAPPKDSDPPQPNQ
ncbi:hypothetical protein KIH39_24605 [Telmatocola sphagniphila]|jgi:hypothetical protein|uniref:SHOCT domain-containing protein n=1 Tax=Telmatocola sphagniphila TaxID=1123043 RepID=A0A8E6B4V0_9BACT|nr:hypothetical protein [Telmatocola sphagniphila]QVL31978.1 hypothetical protein KIH39_24605 [Telmatocola sphagniphila]